MLTSLTIALLVLLSVWLLCGFNPKVVTLNEPHDFKTEIERHKAYLKVLNGQPTNQDTEALSSFIRTALESASKRHTT